MHLRSKYQNGNGLQEPYFGNVTVPFLLRRMIPGYTPFKQQARKEIELEKIIIIASSTGGAKAVEEILYNLPANFPAAILIAQHVPKAFSEGLLKRLQKVSLLPIYLGKEGMELKPGEIYLAPGGMNMFLSQSKNKKNAVIRLENTESYYGDTPSADMLMRSAAIIFRENAIGVILSGLGKDGSDGAREICSYNGHVIVQNKDTSRVFSMARTVIANGHAHSILPVNHISYHLQSKVLNNYKLIPSK